MSDLIHSKSVPSYRKQAVCLPDMPYPKVVVIGAGFAGINLVKKLRGKPVHLVLLDKNNFHQFQPLLYQVAIAGLEPDSIITPVRKLFQKYANLSFRMAEVVEIDTVERKVITDIGWVPYDYLVVATGSISNYYGLKNVQLHSVGLKDIRDALRPGFGLDGGSESPFSGGLAPYRAAKSRSFESRCLQSRAGV